MVVLTGYSVQGMYGLQIFGYYSVLHFIFTKIYAIMKSLDPEVPALHRIAGVTVKPFVKYLGIQLGNLSVDKAYAP